MTEYKNDPAFPGQFVHGAGQIESWTGMSLRDYFAAKAILGLLASPSTSRVGTAKLAQDAYKMADAMIEARK